MDVRGVIQLGIGCTAALALAACGSSGSHPATPRAAAHHKVAVNAAAARLEGPLQGAFAGYQLERRQVRAIAASWRVPEISKTSKRGSGSTWIGVQQPQGGHFPFIQVGTTDQRYASGLDLYTTFWSDTTRHFHPWTLFNVVPGDRIHATLTLTRRGWLVHIVDLDSHVSRTFTTHEETGTAIRQADWFQEDPAKGSGPARLPYATVTPVPFTALTVNGAAPPAEQMVPGSISLPRTDVEPSSLLADGFSIRARPRAPQPQVAALDPPPGFSTGATQPPQIGVWTATGTVRSSLGYGDNPLQSNNRRTWRITRSCGPSPSGCTYMLTRNLEDADGSPAGFTQATLRPTHDGWEAIWPEELSTCASYPAQVEWNKQTMWLIRFLDRGTVAQAHESDLSYVRQFGYGRSSIVWNARLLR